MTMFGTNILDYINKYVFFIHVLLANQAALSLIMISILSGIFEFTLIHPQRRLNKADLVFSIFFSISCYSLLSELSYLLTEYRLT